MRDNVDPHTFGQLRFVILDYPRILADYRIAIKNALQIEASNGGIQKNELGNYYRIVDL